MSTTRTAVAAAALAAGLVAGAAGQAQAAPRQVPAKCPEIAIGSGPNGERLCRHPERAVHVTTRNGTVHRVQQGMFPWDVNDWLREWHRDRNGEPWLFGSHLSVKRQHGLAGRRNVLVKNIVRVNVVKIRNSYVIALPPA